MTVIPTEQHDQLIKEHKQLQKRIRLWAALSNVGRVLSSTLEPDQVLQLVLDQAVEVLEAEGGSLILVDEHSKELVFELAIGPTAADLVGTRMQWGVGLVGEAAATGQPLIVNDTATDPRWFSGYDEATDFVTQSILCAPMITRQQVIGVLEIVNKRDGSAFDQGEAELLGALAAQAATALTNARLYAETRRQTEEVSALLETSHAITSTIDLDQRLEIIGNRAKDLVEAKGCIIFLLDDEEQVLRPILALDQYAEQYYKITLDLGQGISGQVVQTGQGRIVNRVHECPDAYSVPGTPEESQALLAVPLQVKGMTIGVMTLTRESEKDFTSHDLELISSLGNLAAAAIENATLYNQQQERAESLQRAYDELAKIDRLKDELVQNISHELRTPITFIKGYVSLLLDKELGEINEEQSQSLRVVSDKTEQLISLVSSILTLQTVSADSLRLEAVSPIELADRAIEGASLTAQEIGVRIMTDYPDYVLPVMVDPSRITQVFDNLLQNAIKFSPDGGTIAIRVGVEADKVRVEVSDTGIGIASDKVEHIFDRFYQVDGSMTRRFGGAGLGLAICKQIVDAHGGQIRVESEEGIGSTFIFTLPVADQSDLMAMG